MAEGAGVRALRGRFAPGMSAMEPTTTYRPRVSRETRLLLTAAFLAVLVLSLLARIRFRDRPAPSSPIPAVLSQLTSRPKLDELASEIADVTARVRPAVLALDPDGLIPGGSRRATRFAGLRVRDDVAVAWLPAPARRAAPGLIAADRASGIALVRTATPRPSPRIAVWAPRAPLGPRYLVATEIVGEDVSLRPVFVASFEPIETPLWPDSVWAVPDGSTLSAGSLVFTSDAEVVGLVIAFEGRRTLVPAATLLDQAERLRTVPQTSAGTLGIEVQALTPALAAATGSSTGVIVAWVDREGAAHGRLKVGDVIEAVDGKAVSGRGDWEVRAARLAAGAAATLRVRSRGTVEDLAVVAAAVTPSPTDTLGLRLRARPRTGAEVADVAPGSAGDRAGLAVADVITLVDQIPAPTPVQVTRAFASLGEGGRVILGVARGDTHFVTVLERAK